MLISAAKKPFFLDKNALNWIRKTLTELSTEDKVRQLMNVASHGDDISSVAPLVAGGIGGVTRFGGASLESAWAATRALAERSTVPLLISGDIEGGAIALPYGTALTNQLGLAATDSVLLNEQAVTVLAREARSLGYNWSFTPVTDINAAFRSAIVATRSYGSDVERITAHALANVRSFQRHGIAATAKHWPGEGFDDRDQHLVTTINPLDEATWQTSFGKVYRQLIDAGVMTIMSGHIAWPAYARRHGVTGLETCRPASASHLLNQTLLRGELGFKGLIVSDASGMGGLASWADRAEFVPQIIANGCDMLLFPSPFEDDFKHLMNALSDGRLTEARLEAAVTQVLRLKAALGLHRMSLDELVPPLAEAQRTVRAPAHLEVAQQVAQDSVTLVKDVHHTLPLTVAQHRRIVLVTDPQRKGFATQSPLPLMLPEWLREVGFEVRDYDGTNPPTPDNTDLVLYLLAQESLLNQSHIYMDWMRLHGEFKVAMRRHWHQLPCVLVSFGHPYYLYDAPRMPCVINAYTAVEPVQRAVLACLLGRARFAGKSPVDAACGLADAAY